MPIENRRESSGVVLVIDRVMHYHAATMKAIESGLAAKGIKFSILSAQDSDAAVGRVALRDKVVGNHRHFRLTERRIGRFMLRFQHGLLGIVSPVNPAVVVSTCHSGTLSEWLLLLWAGRRGIRRVAWQCGYEYNPNVVKRFLLKRLIPLFDFHLCYHTNAQKYAIDYGAAQRQTLVMHNTIDESRIISEGRASAKLRLATEIPQIANKKVVLFVGAVLEEKRLDSIFHALDLLGDDSLFFMLVGDGPYLSVLKQRYSCRTDWLSTGSVIHGVAEYFDAADVFVLPGTGGLAINEAMAHRLPVISGYADGSADDLVLDGETGFRLQTDEPRELANKLRQLFADPQLSEAMGAKGEALVRGHLSFESFIGRVVSVLVTQHEMVKVG